MKLDHVSYAAEADGLHATAQRIGQQLGIIPVDGGIHPSFGTRNMILPLASGKFIEVVEVLAHPAADKAPFGQAVRARSECGGGWMGWVVATNDLTPIEEKLQRDSVPGHRHRPDGVELTWRQIGVKGLIADAQLPFFIHWDANSPHPSKIAPSKVKLTGVQIAGDPKRVTNWIGLDPNDTPDDVDFKFVAPHGTPGILSVTFETRHGTVEI